MKSIASVFFVLFIVLAEAYPQDVIASDPKVPLSLSDSDQFSGKTINSSKMAAGVIRARIGNSPRVGEQAPDFMLYSLDRKALVSLTALYQKKPVVLLFSSWTCRAFKESALGLVLASPAFKDSVEFVFVYIREAYPGDGAFGDIPDPISDQERINAAKAFKKQTRLPFPILVDYVDDRTATRWAAWPVRAYVVDTDGRVVNSGAQGPWGYRSYEGFLHGDGKWFELDKGFNHDSWESFLTSRFVESKSEQ